MHIITKPVIVNGKRIGPNRLMQAIYSAAEHPYVCECEVCKIWFACLDTCGTMPIDIRHQICNP